MDKSASLDSMSNTTQSNKVNAISICVEITSFCRRTEGVDMALSVERKRRGRTTGPPHSQGQGTIPALAQGERLTTTYYGKRSV
ncbi:hypothetical protein BBBOND_0109560 [Babesia bigemina]|uniref:Uncharacterized protein n=1 Tax=Babesia bigemina TaxID=5866 RepID=A0A061D201_BABBI|nr:hypothetical protein BBBOND_0109560 [Babesia bigemina]CDR94658.1 hypothetical protein BBBOND_0109560 [Babesia bigemina]|eukprot:XP_012766844.1 hypothetical protein BBBOND_0109560 [Babesia bigemina]